MQDWYEVLGVPTTATAAEVRQAYARLARTLHPDRFSDPNEKKVAEARFADVTTAFNTLANPRSRQEYDEARMVKRPETPAEHAADAFARAQGLVESKPEEAVALLRAAVHFQPDEARYQAALGRALSRVPNSARDAIQALERAATLDPHDAGVLIDLAPLLAAHGMHIRARRALETAQRLAPDDPRVMRVAAELGLSDPQR